MRIRRRGAPPPPPDLPSWPPRPQLHRRNDQSVQTPCRHPAPPPPVDDRRTPDLPLQTGGLILWKGGGFAAKKDQEIAPGEEGGGGGGGMRLASPSNRRGSSPSAGTSAVMEQWREEDRTVPLKKRRATFEMETVTENKAADEKSRTVRVRKKRPKKRVEDEEDEEYEIMAAKNNRRKGRSGAGSRMFLEGSRCSRVNGRGWRCHQQTLVGYSLCEHHLGKGRLKSMSSVQSSPQTAPLLLDKPTKLEELGEESDEEYEDRMVEKKKKKKKMGGVKARSMSSLLGQTVTSPELPVTMATAKMVGDETTQWR